MFLNHGGIGGSVLVSGTLDGGGGGGWGGGGGVGGGDSQPGGEALTCNVVPREITSTVTNALLRPLLTDCVRTNMADAELIVKSLSVHSLGGHGPAPSWRPSHGSVTKRRHGGSGPELKQGPPPPRVLSRFFLEKPPFQSAGGAAEPEPWVAVLEGPSWRVERPGGAQETRDTAPSGRGVGRVGAGTNGSSSEFVCLEMDETKVNALERKWPNQPNHPTAVVHRSPQKSEEPEANWKKDF
uniref:Uncharacterized protein n=1 Tax=Knipowitschia caucasica TaxID=637954 RepID=A0AAV2LFN3_KNICA